MDVASDVLRMDDTAMFGLDAVTTDRDLCVWMQELGHLFSFLWPDTDNRAVGEQRTAKLSLGPNSDSRTVPAADIFLFSSLGCSRS